MQTFQGHQALALNRRHFRAPPTPLCLQSSGAKGRQGTESQPRSSPGAQGSACYTGYPRVFKWSTGDPTLALGPTGRGMLWPGRPPLETTGWQARGSRASWGSTEMEVLTITLWREPAHAAGFLRLQIEHLGPCSCHLHLHSLWTDVLGPRGVGRLSTHSPLPHSDSTICRDADLPPGLMSHMVT